MGKSNSNLDSSSVSIAPPSDFKSRNPSSLFSHFRRLGNWRLADVEAGVDAFLVRPLGGGTINKWSSGNGIPKGKFSVAFLKFVRANCTNEVEQQWVDAFKVCWASFVSREPKSKAVPQAAPGESENIADVVLGLHANWIVEQNAKPLRDEPFALPDIYVPIHLIAYGSEGVAEGGKTVPPTFLNAFSSQDSFELGDASWLFVKGGPGSGKSVLANMLATELCNLGSVAVGYFNMSRASRRRPLHPNGLPEFVDDTCGPLALLDYFKSSGRDRFSLVLDGLDEIGGDGKSTQEKVEQSLFELRDKISDVESVGKTVRIVVFGRESVTEIAAKNFDGQPVLLFSMGDLSGQIEPQTEFGSSVRYADDMRSLWWAKFSSARGYGNADQVPKFLSHSVHSLYNLGKEPLLAYLICRSVLTPNLVLNEENTPAELLDAGITSANRNNIYEKIIDDVRSSKKWMSGREKPVLPSEQFLDVLRHIALATWQEGSSRSATIRRILDVITSDETNTAFKRLVTHADDHGTSNLLTAFYYRITEVEEERLEHEFEFTHKTFSEYLLATLIFDAFEKLIEDQKPGVCDTLKVANQQAWIELVMAGPDSREIAKFILDEAELRFERRPFNVWSRAFDVLRELASLVTISQQEQQPWMSGHSSAMRIKRATEMVFLVWGALNRKRFVDTKEHIELGTDNVIEGHELALMRGPYNLEQFFDGAEIGAVEPETFLASALSGLFIREDDLCGLFLNNGSILGLKLADLNGSMSVWHDVSITDFDLASVNLRNSRFIGWSVQNMKAVQCNFRQSRFQRITLSSAELSDCWFEQSVLENGTFNSCRFSAVYFNRSDLTRCTFVNCKFNDCEFEACLVDDEMQFMNCEFSDTGLERSVFKDEFFEDCKGMRFI